MKSEDIELTQLPPNGSSSPSTSGMAVTPLLPQPKMSPEQWKFWFEIAMKKHAGTINLLYSLCTWAMETIPLLVTIMLLIVDRVDDSSSEMDDILWTGVLHIITTVFRLIIDLSRPPRPQRNAESILCVRKSKLNYFYGFLANLLMVSKPYRAIIGHFYFIREGKSVRNKVRSRKPLDIDEIESVIEMNQKELKEASENVLETYIQTVPMALLHLYLLFQNNQRFQLCSRADVSRLFMFIFCICLSAKKAADYDWNYNNHLKSLHFLYFFKTNQPINLETQTLLTYVLNFLSHFFLILHRFYVISFFLSVSRVLVGIYIFTQFTINWVMLLIFPSLRVPYENPPFGTPTIISEILDRWINIFTNHNTKFTWFSAKRFKIRNLKFRLPLSLLQVIPFTLTMLVTFLFSYITGDDWEQYQLLRSLKRIPTVAISIVNTNFTKEIFSNNLEKENSSTIFIPCTNFTISGLPVWASDIGEFIFQTHHSFSNRFGSFNDIFGVFHFLWFSVILYLIICTTYSFYLYQFGLYDHMYPVNTAYQFWHYLINKQVDKSCEEKRKKCIRKLMTYTLMEQGEFYRFYLCSRFGCRKIFCRNSEDEALSQASANLIKGLTERGGILQSKIKQVLCMNHLLQKDFENMYKILATGRQDENDLKLFLLFYQQFDNLMRNMTSFRIRILFSMLRVTPNKRNLDE